MGWRYYTIETHSMALSSVRAYMREVHQLPRRAREGYRVEGDRVEGDQVEGDLVEGHLVEGDRVTAKLSCDQVRYIWTWESL